jgi:hypothetical protein
LANYGVDSEVVEGKLSLTDQGVVWISNGTSNLASVLGIEYDDWTLGSYAQESDKLGDTEDDDHTITKDTKIVDLQDSDGNSLGITEGEYVVYQNGTVTFYHSGRIAVGNKGSGKVSELRAFVESRYPKIISGNKFNLGVLNYNRNWTLDDSEVVELIENLISYALVRDEYRAFVKEQ